MSDSGEVRSLNRTVHRCDGKSQCFIGRTIRPMINSKGYHAVRLSAPGRRVVTPVHRVVAIAFHINPSGLREVNHIDANKLNNVASNLEWVDSSGNKRHAWKMGLRRSVPFLPSPPTDAEEPQQPLSATRIARDQSAAPKSPLPDTGTET